MQSMKNTVTYADHGISQQDLFGIVDAAARAAGLTPTRPPRASRKFTPPRVRRETSRKRNKKLKEQIALDLAAREQLKDRIVNLSGRKCLRCREKFHPDHRDTWICGKCKRTDEWKSGNSSFAL